MSIPESWRTISRKLSERRVNMCSFLYVREGCTLHLFGSRFEAFAAYGIHRKKGECLCEWYTIRSCSIGIANPCFADDSARPEHAQRVPRVLCSGAALGTVPDCPGMAERNFIVLRYEGKVPAMAGCEKCLRKFFTPAICSCDVVGAQEYLFSKFDHHNCDDSSRKLHSG